MNNKIAFISDIHGNVYALQKVLESIENKNIDKIYCIGDSVGYGTRPNEVLEIIKDKNIPSVLGNVDNKMLTSKIEEADLPVKWTMTKLSGKNKAFINTFKESLSIEFCGKSFLLTHGSPVSISDYCFEADEQKQIDIANNLKENVIVMGHTHLPYSKFIAGKLFINAGSVGRPKDNDTRACYVIVEVFSDNIKVAFERVEYDYEKLAKEIENSELPNAFADIIRTADMK